MNAPLRHTLSLFGRRLRMRRQEAGMTLAALAETIDVDASNIVAFELGEKPPPAEFIRQAAYAMRLTPCELADLQAIAEMNCPVAPDENENRSAKVFKELSDLSSAVIIRLDDYLRR